MPGAVGGALNPARIDTSIHPLTFALKKDYPWPCLPTS